MNSKSIGALALAIGLALASDAAAQATGAAGQAQVVTATGTATNPTFDVSVGYQWLHAPDQNFPFGLNVDGARNFGPWSLVGELGWAHGSNDDLGSDISLNLWHLGAGGRWTGRSTSRVWPFAQVLAGAAHARAHVDDGIEGEDSASDTRFMLQPGVGASILLGDGWGVVGQVDYRRIFLDEDEDGTSGENEVRLFIGLRVVLD
jgi:hypothetical protein